MSTIERRTILYALGAASISPLLSVEAHASGRVAVCKPGESRFLYASAHQAKLSPCKLTSDDSRGVAIGIVKETPPGEPVPDNPWFDFSKKLGELVHWASKTADDIVNSDIEESELEARMGLREKWQ